MRKVFKLEEIDCANCAAKMEESIKKIAGVQDASISFLMQRLTLEAEEENFETILLQVKKIISKIEPDCKIK